MEQISKERLQNKAHSMVACLEFIKLNIRTKGESGVMANGKRKLEMWKSNMQKMIGNMNAQKY